MNRCLIIDDEDIIVRLAKGACMDVGLDADDAADLSAAVRLAASNSYQLVILDHHVGETLGHEILEEIIEHVVHAAVIVITADRSDDVRARYSRIGLLKVVHKPLSRSSLAATISSALGR
jgi:DNA-binding response OmpR family regulator